MDDKKKLTAEEINEKQLNDRKHDVTAEEMENIDIPAKLKKDVDDSETQHPQKDEDTNEGDHGNSPYNVVDID